MEAEKLEGFGVRKEPRRADSAAALELLELALKQSPGQADAWLNVSALAQAGKLSLEQKKAWSELLLKVCGQKYPDFSLTVLAPMVETVQDPAEQNKLWNAAFNMFQRRMDLAAFIRMAQGKMWEDAGNTANAGKCYMDVIDRYANAGPFILPALQGAERLLKADKKEDKVLVLYDQTFAKIQKPQDMAGPFMTQSNWYRVGTLYASKLMEAGKATEAAALRQKIGAGR